MGCYTLCIMVFWGMCAGLLVWILNVTSWIGNFTLSDSLAMLIFHKLINGQCTMQHKQTKMILYFKINDPF